MVSIRKKFLSRRKFIKNNLTIAIGFSLLGACKQSQGRPEIVVIGGGIGGVSFVRSMLILMPDVNITVIEPTSIYHNCPLSSHVLAALLPDEKVKQSYLHISSLPNVNWIKDKAEQIDYDKRQVITASGAILPYDKLVVSPGIDFITQGIENYDARLTPHGWKNNSSLFDLKSQLQSMPDGGVFIIASPQKPYRCTPAPYERASLVASYLKIHKPASKLLILDQKPSFPQQELYMDAWQQNFGDMIEWVTGDFVGEISAYKANEHSLETEFDSFRGDVINLIPNQQAGYFAQVNGLTNESGWCPVDLRSMASTLISDVYVIGDAIDSNELPKAASISETQAHVAAQSISASLKGQNPSTATFNSLCWSATGAGHALKIMGDYHVEPDGTLIRDSLALSSAQDADKERADNYGNAQIWNSELFLRLYGAQ